MRLLKKSLSVLLAAVMVFALCSGVLADEPEPILIAPPEVIAPAPVLISPASDLTGKTVILHSNDVHGAVAGYAYIAALKAQYEAQGAEVILVDAGDYSQGTTYVSLSKGLDAVMLMNETGYDIATLGNHEFDYGYAQLVENMKAAEFKVLCADVLDENSTPIFDANYVYTTKSGVKVGFFGMETPEAQTKANPALVKGLKFLTDKTSTTIYKAAQNQVDAMKDADIVICLSHLGVDEESAPFRSYDLYNNVNGIDFIIDGHSHTVMEKGESGEPIQSTGTAFTNIGVILIDDAAKAIEGNMLVEITEDSAKDEKVAAAAQSVIDAVDAAYGEVFAKSDVELNGAKAPNGNRDSETNNGDLITDAMIWCVTEQYPGSITGVPAENILAITNGGGIRAAIKPGDVTKNDIFTVLPFGNTVAVIYVTGTELLEALEASTYCTPTAVGGFPQVSGIKFSIDTSKEFDAKDETYPASTYYGPKSIQRVSIDSVNGKAFDAAAKYAVVTNNFCAGGGDTYYAFAAASEQFDTGYTLDTVVMDYITTKLEGVIGEDYAAPQGRISFKGVNPFTDVADGTYYKDAVIWANDNGITNGTSTTTFSPNIDVTCEQAMTFLYRYADKVLGDGFTGDWMFLLKYADADKISAWANEAMHYGAMNEILKADDNNCINPKTALPRGELVCMLYRLALKLGLDTSTDPDTNYLSFSELIDVAENEELLRALIWAQDKGIMLGDGQGNLMPFTATSRAHFVTMLNRFATNVVK